MPDAPLTVAHERARLICARIREMVVPHNDQAVQVTVSVGLAVVPAHGNTGEDALLRADRALYLAKETGRNRIIIYSEWISPGHLVRHRMMHNLNVPKAFWRNKPSRRFGRGDFCQP